MQKSSRSDLITIGVAYLSFIGLGLNAGLLGLAWPSIQAEFNARLDAAGILLFASTIGYLIASFYSGAAAYRIGVGRMFALGGALMSLGLLGSALTQSWWILTIMLVMTGLGSGLIDAGLNSYLAQHHSARAMNWLHACFGIGVTVGPLIMTALLAASIAWRWGYAIVSAYVLFIMILFLVTLPHWKGVVAHTEAAPRKRSSMWTILKMPVVWMGIVMFGVYAGLEATPGQWVYTWFTQARSIAAESAGLWVSIYWGSFTIGRIFFGAIITRLNTLALLRGCMLGAVFGALLLWWNPVEWVGFAGLTILGFAQAPLFPVLVSNTPGRVGAHNAPDVIGFQVAFAGVGVAALPALAGVLAQHISLDTVPVFILCAAALVFILHELSVAQAGRIAAQAAAAGD